ncbi:hypothetical protein CEXT_603841 [Caerostris extrusa]|uniref:Uncharacterized protein n=1 Tax=Caerostris extrusa TaxID=172846 RepID=A0AAV4STL8_CAEEX|nr:hypothetical protein CEXT_603841 [Caerostris extrusa]
MDLLKGRNTHFYEGVGDWGMYPRGTMGSYLEDFPNDLASRLEYLIIIITPSFASPVSPRPEMGFGMGEAICKLKDGESSRV